MQRYSVRGKIRILERGRVLFDLVCRLKELSVRTAYYVSQHMVTHFGLQRFLLCKSNSHYVYQIISRGAQRPVLSD